MEVFVLLIFVSFALAEKTFVGFERFGAFGE
jgi:hypothetical protein